MLTAKGFFDIILNYYIAGKKRMLILLILREKGGHFVKCEVKDIINLLPDVLSLLLKIYYLYNR